MENREIKFRDMVKLIVCFILTFLFISCGKTNINFTIDWSDVLETLGLVLLGGLIVIIILMWLFRNFRIY